MVKASQVLYGTDYPYRDGAEVNDGIANWKFSAAAALAVLDTVADHDFLTAVRSKGERLALGLRGTGLDVRGLGLMLAFRTGGRPRPCPPRSHGAAPGAERHRTGHRAPAPAAHRVR